MCGPCIFVTVRSRLEAAPTTRKAGYAALPRPTVLPDALPVGSSRRGCSDPGRKRSIPQRRIVRKKGTYGSSRPLCYRVRAPRIAPGAPPLLPAIADTSSDRWLAGRIPPACRARPGFDQVICQNKITSLHGANQDIPLRQIRIATKPALNGLHGFLTCLVPCDYIPRRSWAFFQAWEILEDLAADRRCSPLTRDRRQATESI